MQHPGQPERLVLYLEYPFLMAQTKVFHTRNTSMIDTFLKWTSDNGILYSKVPGYQIYLIYKGSMIGERIQKKSVPEELESLAQEFLTQVINAHPERYYRSKDGGDVPSD